MNNKICRYVLSFLAVNILVLIPVVWMLTGIIHDRLDYEVLTARPISLFEITNGRLGRSVAVDGQSDVQLTKMYLSSATDKSQMGFGFGNGPVEFDIVSISIRSHLMVKWTLDLDSLVNDFTAIGGLDGVSRVGDRVHVKLSGNDGGLVLKPSTSAKWHASFSPDRRVAALIVALEFAVFVLCFIAFLIKRDKETMGGRIFCASTIALLVAGFYSLVVPLQSYLGNLETCKFGLSQLLPELLLGALSTFLAVVVVLLVLERFFGKFFHLLLFGVVLYGYLEIGMLSIGAPVLNGDTIYYSNMTRGLTDAAIAAAVIGLPVLFYRWTKSYVHWAALALLVLVGSSVFDAHSKPEPKAENCLVKEFLPKPEVLASAYYSSGTNVLLFCLDSVTTEISTKLMRESPELQEKFPGFLAYENNIGMHGFTALGVPGFMTGEYYSDPTRAAEYTFSIFREKSFIKPYLDRDIPTFCNDGAYDFGFTNRRKVNAADASKETLPCMQRRPGAQLDWNLNEIVQFRLTPFILKQWVSSMIVVGWDSSFNCSNEGVCYPFLAQAPIVEDESMTMHYHHTFGCHLPFQVDRNGLGRGTPRNDYAGACDKTYYVLKQLGDLFEIYRKRGIYDNAFIIVCSDHGDRFTARNITDPKKFVPGRGLAMLWVKPIGAKTPFAISALPTSSAKICELMKRSCTERLSADDVDRIVKTEKRMFRHEDGIFYDWIVDADGNVEYRETKPTVDMEKLDVIKIGKSYSLKFYENRDSIPIAYEGVSAASALSPMVLERCNEFSVSVKVPDSNKKYSIILGVRIESDTSGSGKVMHYGKDKYFQLYDTQGNEVGEHVDFTSGMYQEPVVSGLSPDERGVVKLIGKRRGFEGRFYIVSFKIVEE